MSFPLGGTAAVREQLHAQETALHAQRQRAIRLRHEYQEALKEDKIAGSAILNGRIHCAAKECLQLANLMYRKLPTELRDLVYRFLCIEDRAIPVGPYYHFRPYDHTRIESPDHALAMGLARGRSLDDHRNKPDPALLMPDSHIFNQTYMGQDVTSEAVKTYLTNNTFSICDVEDGISRFLGGAFGTHSPTCGHRMFPNGSTQIAADYGESPIAVRFDLIQPRDYVRKLQVRIKHEQYYHYLERTSPSLLDMFADECHSLRHAKNALRPLQHLPQCTQPLELEFIIVAGGAARQESRQFINFLQALRNTFYALMYDRENTTIKIIHHDENISPFPRDITLLWSLTKEQWEQEKAANRGKRIWDADFYLALEGLDDGEAHAGFPAADQETLLRERWGIEDVFLDRRPKWPIQEGRYWPVGNGQPGWL